MYDGVLYERSFRGQKGPSRFSADGNGHPTSDPGRQVTSLRAVILDDRV
jgi:hypothetical protein